MYEIFISYRRDDTKNWAGPLFRDLRARFGGDSVFMDTYPGRIPWGANWQKELASALQRCDALLALIGPQWVSCTRSDGRRRLDVDDDWVRREIATALTRGVLVMPVLFEGAVPPREAELPEELRTLGFASCQCNERPITSGPSWEADVELLIKELVKRPVLKELHDLATAQTGIRRLEELISGNTAVHDAVVRSQNEIERTDREIGELKLLKDVHDALHTIEHECLVPLRTDASDELMLQAQIRFAAPSSIVRAAARAHEQAFPLLTVLVNRLDVATSKLEAAVNAGGDAARHEVLGELETLIAEFPEEFHKRISQAATKLQLDRLTQQVATVKAALPLSAVQDPELKPLIEAIDALNGLRERLERLVGEHGLLQALDMTLRFVCVGMEKDWRGPSADRQKEVALEWKQIEDQRMQLKAPFSQELQEAGIGILGPLESKIKAIVQAGDSAMAIKHFKSYFQAVGSVFWALNASLKKFCADLDEKSQRLKTMLSQTEVRHE